MLDKETRIAIFALHKKGHKHRKIARTLKISRDSVKKVLESGVTEVPKSEHKSNLDDHLNEIRSLYEDCQGNLIRVQEELSKQNISVSYSSLTWFCRKHGIGVKEKIPTRRIVTAPAEEMQHDTSPYNLELDGKKVKRHCASLVLGYSRMMYIQFYPKFDRFHCKIFLTEAFRYFGGLCKRCVIDNASIVIACGTGPDAEVAPEMQAFEKRFGFYFLAHRIGHANRSGKVERPFYYIERNFLVGRKFKNDDDLNAQALRWLAETAHPRTIRELKASPKELYAAEQPLLVPLPLHCPDVYRSCFRIVDAYGCVSLHSFKYPVPAAYIGKDLMLREYKDRVIVLDGSKEVANHPKKLEGGPLPPSPAFAPRRQKRARLLEEEKLKALGEPIQDYLSQLKSVRPSRYVFSVKRLYRLLCHYKAEDLKAALMRALEYRLFDIIRIESILLENIAKRDYELPFTWDIENYENLKQYRDGAATPEPDFEDYMPEEDKNEEDEYESGDT